MHRSHFPENICEISRKRSSRSLGCRSQSKFAGMADHKLTIFTDSWALAGMNCLDVLTRITGAIEIAAQECCPNREPV